MRQALTDDELAGAVPVTAAPARRALSDAELEGATPVEAAAAPPTETPGRLEAVLRGARSGVTFGFGDELSGLLEHVLTGKPYEKARDESRAADKAAKEAHRALYTASEIGGGVATAFIPGVGAAGNLVKGAGFGANAIRGAGAGILAGIGNSEADLTKGDVAGVAKDAALSGLAGGAVGGVVGTAASKLLGGAAGRVEAAETAGLKEGIQYSTKLKTFGKATPEAPEGQWTANIKDALKTAPEIRDAATKAPGRALQLVDEKVTHLTDKLDDIYAKAQTGGSVPIEPVQTHLAKVEAQYRRTVATEGLADEVARVSERLTERNEAGTIPLQILREEYRAWQDSANKAMRLFSSKSPKEEVSEDMANALRDALQEHVAAVAKAKPELGISRELLQQTNKEVSTWIRVQQALAQKASRENFDAAPFGDTVNFVGRAIKHPIRAVGELAAKASLPADRQIAKMLLAAQRGDKVAQMGLRAIYPGIPRGLAANATDIPGAALSAAASPFLPDDSPY